MIVCVCDGPECPVVQPPNRVFYQGSPWIVRSGQGGNEEATHFCSPHCEYAFLSGLEDKMRFAKPEVEHAT